MNTIAHDKREYRFSAWQAAVLAVAAIACWGIAVSLLALRCRGWIALQRGTEAAQQAFDAPADLVVERSILFQGALEHVRAAVGLLPFASQAYFEYAEVLMRIADDPRVAAAVDRTLTGARASDAQDVRLRAAELYRKALLHEPSNPIAHQRLAVAYDDLGMAAEGAAQIGQALALDPHNVRLRLAIAYHYFGKGDLDTFRHYRDEALAIDRRGGYRGGLVHDFFYELKQEELATK